MRQTECPGCRETLRDCLCSPDQPRARWLVADPETGALIEPDWAVAIDLDRLTPEQIDAATDASELDAIPADVLAESVNLSALLADGLRWRAWMSTPYNAEQGSRGDSWQAPATVPCASCYLAGLGYRAVDVRTAEVVPWDVMGDPRAYALVCPECAEVTPEPAPVSTCAGCDSQEAEGGLCDECFETLRNGEWVTVSPTHRPRHNATGDKVNTPAATPNPGHVCDTCGTETPAIWWHYHVTGDGTPDKGRRYCEPCWDNLPGDEVTA